MVKHLPLVLLALAIGLSPSFSVGTFGKFQKIVEIRIEDILIVILGLIWIAGFLISGRKKIEKPPLFKPILVWLGIGFFSVLTNWIFGNLEISWGFFFFLKEIEFFFLYFYVFYHIKSLESVKFIIKIWIFLGLVNVIWIIYQIITGLRLTYYYGPTAFFEPGGSFPSGGFFMVISIFLINILLFYYLTFNISSFKKVILGIIIVSLAIGTLVSGSRASFWGLVFAFLFTFFLAFLKKKNLKILFLAILIVVFLSVVFVYLSSLWPEVKRPLNLKESLRLEYARKESFTRIGILKTHLEEALEHPLSIFFGFGVLGEAHGQYTRNLLERGIIGSLVFFWLMFAIIKNAFQGFLSKGDAFTTAVSIGLFATTFAMLLASIPNDPFMVVKIAEVYWFFAALTMAVFGINKKERNYVR